MKLDQLRQIIREEVRSAVKAELQDVMNEAVKAASDPTLTASPEQTVYENKKSTPTLENVLSSRSTPAIKTNLQEMLNQTRSSMTNEEYKNVFSGTSDMVSGGPNMASNVASQMGMNSGLDISNLSFVKNASKVYNASKEKDLNK